MLCCPRFDIPPSRVGSVFLLAARSRSIRSHVLHREGLLASPPELLDDRPDFLNKRRRQTPGTVGKVSGFLSGSSYQGPPSLVEPGIFSFHTVRHEQGTEKNSMKCSRTANLYESPEVDVTSILSHMDQQATVPSVTMYRSLLKACARRKALVEAKRVHAHLLKHGLESSKFLGEYAVSSLVKCNGLEAALPIFQRLKRRSAFSWTAIISGHSMYGNGQEALRMYQRMQAEGVQPSSYTFVSLLQACSSIPDLEEGKRIHRDVCQSKWRNNLFVGTSLIDMYGKCGSITDAQKVFNELYQPDVASWNAILSAYIQHSQAAETFYCYKQMLAEGEVPDGRTFVTILLASGMLADREQAPGSDVPRVKSKSLYTVKVIYAQARRMGYDADLFVANSLLSAFRKCGSITDAQNVFDQLPYQSLASWNALLAAYIEEGQPEEGMYIYEQMQEEGVSPDPQTFVSMLQGCVILSEKEHNPGGHISVAACQRSKEIHADVVRRGYDENAFLTSTLIHAYVKCSSFEDAWNVFEGLSERSVVAWNVMLLAYAEQGVAGKALSLYEEMHKEIGSPNDRTFVTLLQACAMLGEEEGNVSVCGTFVKLQSLQRVREVHACVRAMGYDKHPFVGGALVSAYGKCGSIDDAQIAFDELSQRDVIACTALIGSYVEQGQADRAFQLFDRMGADGVSPECHTFVSILQACGILAEKEIQFSVDGRITKSEVLRKGKAIHAHAVRKGYGSNAFLCTALISMYGKCGSVEVAEDLFYGQLLKNVVTWTAMLSMHVAQGQPEKALQLYEQMVEEGVTADGRTYVVMLQACSMHAVVRDKLVGHASSHLKLLEKGKVIHSEARRMGYTSDALVGSTLISMYARLGELLAAQYAFDAVLRKSVVCWTALMSAYTQQGQPEKSLDLYEKMQEQGVSPNHLTVVTALSACASIAEREESVLDEPRECTPVLGIGKALHARARRQGYDSVACVGNALMSMYGKCGSVGDALNLFLNGLCHKTGVSWNAMLTVYVENRQDEDALRLYIEAQREGVSPDVWTFVRALQACGIAAEKEGELMMDGLGCIKPDSLQMVRSIHAEVQRKGYECQDFIGSTLVSAYGKCGSIADAQTALDGLPDGNVASWTALLTAYIDQGLPEQCFVLYRRMQEHGPSPNDATLVCMVQACSKTGNLTLLRQIHRTVVSRGQNVGPLLASVLVSAYGRCASMDDAESVFNALPQPDAASWNALLSGHARQGNCTRSLQRFDQMQAAGVKPTAVTFVSVLSACSHAGLVEKGLEYFESMSRDHGIRPRIEHYVSVIDLLGRAGWLVRLEGLLAAVPVQPSPAMWSCFLGACQKHGRASWSMRRRCR